jgi:hypothetical protein
VSYSPTGRGRPAGSWGDEATLRPHGSWAAYKRHMYRQEPICGQCREWMRTAKAAQRATQRAAGQPVQR